MIKKSRIIRKKSSIDPRDIHDDIITRDDPKRSISKTSVNSLGSKSKNANAAANIAGLNNVIQAMVKQA